MNRAPFSASSLHRGAAWLAAALAWGTAAAAPVEGSEEPALAGPYELATQWTLAGVPSGYDTLAMPSLEALPPLPGRPRLLLPSQTNAVPDPSGYALMGLGLLVVGLLARRWSAHRGASKKT